MIIRKYGFKKCTNIFTEIRKAKIELFEKPIFNGFEEKGEIENIWFTKLKLCMKLEKKHFLHTPSK